jgi:PTH1 family peptidyl-tRNA hydrolase
VADFAVIGLGNPGEVYRNTRHNLGFWLLDKIAEKGNVKFKNSREYHADHSIMPYKESNILLIKPMTFMNESGRYLLSILNYFRCPLANVILIHDELTLPLGELKISKNRGAGGHNGVSSVISALGSSFTRFRIGIGKKSFPQMKLSDFVLSKLTSEECTLLEQEKDNFNNALFSIFDNGVDATMNLINQTRRPQPNQ